MSLQTSARWLTPRMSNSRLVGAAIGRSYARRRSNPSICLARASPRAVIEAPECRGGRVVPWCYARLMTTRWVFLVLLLAACGGIHSAGGPVKPAPPGPLDLVRSLWGDYGGRCPGDYQYCKGGGQAVCCPITSRCEADDGGAYCASRGGAYVTESPAPRCGPDERTCAYRGQM